MPRVIKGEDGQDIEVFEKTEVEATKSQYEAKLKEIEQELNPNWREARQKMRDMEKERDEWMEKAKKAGVKEDASSMTKEEIARIASEKAERLYIDKYKERVLSRFGDKKDAVSKYFEKLANGETLTEEMVDKIADDAARAVGIQRERDIREVHSAYTGVAPRFEQELPDQGFGATDRGKATAQAMGLIIENPKK